MKKFRILLKLFALFGLCFLSACTILSNRDRELDKIELTAPVSKLRLINISPTKAPKGFYSAGIVSNYYHINVKMVKAFPIKVRIYYDIRKLDRIDESSLELFFLDDKAGRIEPVPNSRLDSQARAVEGKLWSAGTVMVIGIPKEQTARQLLRDLDRWIESGTIVEGLEGRVQRTCELIRCAGREQILNDPLLTSLYLGINSPTERHRLIRGVSISIPSEFDEPSTFGWGREIPDLGRSPGGREEPDLGRMPNLPGCDECPALDRGSIVEVVAAERESGRLYPERSLLPERYNPCFREYYSY